MLPCPGDSGDPQRHLTSPAPLLHCLQTVALLVLIGLGLLLHSRIVDAQVRGPTTIQLARVHAQLCLRAAQGPHYSLACAFSTPAGVG